MNSDTSPRPREHTRLMVIDPSARCFRADHTGALAGYLRPHDLLVVNDAATLPASLAARSSCGDAVEIRLLGPPQDELFDAVLLGAGDHRTRTEDRPAPAALRVGDRVHVTDALNADIVALSPLSSRLVRLRFDQTGAALWTQLYAHGRPVQYAHQRDPLELWSVQTLYAARPWAAEMPSAGRFLTMQSIERLARRGVEIARLTHAAGLSSTGDLAIDRALPLPERYDIPQATVEAVRRCRSRQARVIAVGTSVVRALESAYLRGRGTLLTGEATSELRIDAGHTLAVVDGLLTGMHTPEESHYELLRAFVDDALLADSLARARALDYQLHEFGDVCLIARGTLAAQPTPLAA